MKIKIWTPTVSAFLSLTTSQNLQTFFGETKGDIDEFFILIMKYVDIYKIFITQ